MLVREQLGIGAADVALVIPEIQTLVTGLPQAVPESESSRFRLFNSTANFLRNIGSANPTVVVLDDLQAADTPSILLLQFVATQLGDMRLVLIATYRDIEMTPEHPLVPAMHEMTREPSTKTWSLSGLTERQVGRLIVAAAGRAGRSALVARLWRGTSGNPLFVSEAVRLMASEGRLDDDRAGDSLQRALPARLREVIAKRVRQLPAATLQRLVFGAVLGPEFNADVVVQVSDDTRQVVLAALADATRAGLLSPTGTGAYRFSHDLVREALYEELDPAERVRIHQKIATTLERIGAGSDGRLAELAHHYYEAWRGHLSLSGVPPSEALTNKALTYAQRAGQQAADALAYEEASRLYQMAAAVLEMVGSEDHVTKTELLLLSGDAEARAGDLEKARDAFLRAAAIARRTGQVRQLARAALGTGGRLPWARAGSDTGLVARLREALVRLGGEDDHLRARLLTRLACAMRSDAMEREQSDALSQQAVDLARQLDDPSTLAYTLIGRFYATWWPENPADRLAVSNEMVDLAQRLGDGELLVDAHLLVWLTRTEMGQMAEARRSLDEVRRLANDIRQPAHIWLSLGPRVPVALMNGEFGLAEKLIDEEADIRHPITLAGDDLSANRMHRFLLARELGRVEEAEPGLRASVDAFPWYPCHRPAHALALAELDRRAEASAVFADLARNDFSALYRDNHWLFGMCLASEACALLGDAEAAAGLYRQLAPFAGRHSMAHAEGSVGIVDRYLGMLAVTLGRPDDAERHFRDAIRLNTDLAAPPWVAHSQHDLAKALRRRGREGDFDRARELDGQALITATSLGMTTLMADIDKVEEPTSGQASMHGILRREGEYWIVAFEGHRFTLRDSKGLRYLALLLAEPGREFHALDLVGSAAVAEPLTKGSEQGLRVARDKAIPHLDEEAKAAYRERFRDLQEELAEADNWNDPERRERARAEIEFLSHELGRAVGLGGRDRPTGSAGERARLSVTRAIRGALARIDEHSPDLGAHLESTIKTGTYCVYRPDARLATVWLT